MINRSQSYKWYILALGTATHMFVSAMPWMCMPVLFKEISDELGLNLVQIGTVWGMVGLSGVFTSLFSGLVGDRYGTRRTLAVACLLMGIAGALRGLSGGFVSLAAFMFFFGLFGAPVTLTTHKSAGEWFSGRQLGLANGILAMGIGLGITLTTLFSATVFSPLVGGWRNLMFVYGAISAIISLLWLQTRQKEVTVEAASSGSTTSFWKSLSHVIRNKRVWVIAVSAMFFTGCRSGVIGYLPLHLRNSGWPDISADGALSALSMASVIGVIPLSALTDRLGRRKLVVYPAAIIIMIGVGLLSAFNNTAVWFLAIMIGFSLEGIAAVYITMVMETKDVGAQYAGTALGLNTTMAMIGGFFGPPIGNSLAEINPSYAFVFWSAMVLASIAVFFFVHETGWKKRGALPEIKTVADLA